jgi:hypothetical protein
MRRNAADVLLSNVATPQALLPGMDPVNLYGGMTYWFEGWFRLTRSAGTTSHTTGLSLGGTATLSVVDYIASISNPTGNILGNAQDMVISTAANTVVTGTNLIASEDIRIQMQGTFVCSVAGTFSPQFQYSAAPGGAPTVKRGSFLSLMIIGLAGAAAQV